MQQAQPTASDGLSEEQFLDEEAQAEAQDDAQIEELQDRADEVIFGGDTPEGEINGPIMDILRRGSQTVPEQAVAQTSAIVVSRAMSEMQPPPSNAAAAFVVTEVAGELATVAADEGLFDLRQEELDAAGIMAVEVFARQNQQMFPQEETQQDVEVIARGEVDGSMDMDIARMLDLAGEQVPQGAEEAEEEDMG